MIIIIIGNATVLPMHWEVILNKKKNALGGTIAFPMLREPVGNLLHVIFL
jgi:hypothetical protein